MKHSIGLRLYYKKENKILVVESPVRQKDVCLNGFCLEKVEMKLPVFVNRLTEAFMKELLAILKENQSDLDVIDNLARHLQIICKRTIWQENLIDNCNKYDYKKLDWLIEDTVMSLNKGEGKK